MVVRIISTFLTRVEYLTKNAKFKDYFKENRYSNLRQIVKIISFETVLRPLHR